MKNQLKNKLGFYKQLSNKISSAIKKFPVPQEGSQLTEYLKLVTNRNREMELGRKKIGSCPCHN